MSSFTHRRGVLLSLLAGLAAAALLLWFFIPRPPRFIQYRDRQLPTLRGVPVNTLAPEGFAADEQGFVTYQWDGLTARPGIDVSSHQGEIDWQAVADSGVEFAIIRAGFRGYGPEGKLMTDSRFEENLSGALSAGLEVGVYFFSQAVSVDEAVEEARLLLSLIEGEPITFPVVFDWERIPPQRDPRTLTVTGEQLNAMARAFCDTVAQAGWRPAVYANQDLAYLELDLSQFRDVPFWLADYDAAPSFYYRFDLWQYSHTGSVPGIRGTVDLNLSFRDFSPL